MFKYGLLVALISIVGMIYSFRQMYCQPEEVTLGAGRTVVAEPEVVPEVANMTATFDASFSDEVVKPEEAEFPKEIQLPQEEVTRWEEKNQHTPAFAKATAR